MSSSEMAAAAFEHAPLPPHLSPAPGMHPAVMSRPQVSIERLPTRRMSNEPRESMNCKSCRKRKVWPTSLASHVLATPGMATAEDRPAATVETADLLYLFPECRTNRLRISNSCPCRQRPRRSSAIASAHHVRPARFFNAPVSMVRITHLKPLLQ